ncbi:hypothetical protein E4N92_08875 [Treponema denticola]
MLGKKKVNEKELLSSVIDLTGFRSIVANLDETSDWLSDTRQSLKIFNDMLDDARVGSLVENRQDKVLRLDMGQVDGKNERLNEDARYYINFNKLQELGLQLLNALPYGIAVSEIIWKKRKRSFCS